MNVDIVEFNMYTKIIKLSLNFLRIQVLSIIICLIIGYLCGLIVFVRYNLDWDFAVLIDFGYHYEALFLTSGISFILGSILGIVAYWPLRDIKTNRIFFIVLSFSFGGSLPAIIIKPYPILMCWLAITGYVYGVAYLLYNQKKYLNL